MRIPCVQPVQSTALGQHTTVLLLHMSAHALGTSSEFDVVVSDGNHIALLSLSLIRMSEVVHDCVWLNVLHGIA
jgi:hypothetical protein